MILPAIPQNSPIAGPNRITSIWNQVFVAFKAVLLSNTIERMSTVKRDAMPMSASSVGLTIYNTTVNKLQVWTGAAWETVTSV